MPEYHLAASLKALRAEIDRRWPDRDKTSDGWIGDASHQARKSDHNPDWDAGGVVRAIDVDKDGIDVDELLDAVVREPRVAYVIHNRRIASATDDGKPWDWEPYDGDNPHTGHVHISIKHTTAAETDTSPWFTPEEDDMPLTDAEIDRIIDRLLDRKIGPSTVADCLARARALALRFGEKGDLNTQLDRIED